MIATDSRGVPANVCPACAIAWPTGSDTRACPDCGTATELARHIEREYSWEEARRRTAFREFYESWDAERRRRGDPSPEALGALEARRDVAQIRQLEAAL